MAPSIALVWFQEDLRLADHPALHAACKRHDVVIPVYIHAPGEAEPWQPGGASRWWLHHSLAALQSALESRGSRLLLCEGPSAAALAALCRETKATDVYWNRRQAPWADERDAAVRDRLEEANVACHRMHAGLLIPPASLLNRQGAPYQVFTPFWKAAVQEPVGQPLPAPDAIPAPRTWPKSLSLQALGLLPKVDWAGGLREAWEPGESGAHAQLAAFLDGAADHYQQQRDIPAASGVSGLSPHLHFGEITPGQVLDTLHAATPEMGEGLAAFVRQLYWREFAHYLLHHFPHTPIQPLRANFVAFPWRRDAKALRTWQRGETGYPIVDAGMRELWHTGWMHNRVRMVVASFLVKHLLLPWQEGAAWFWDTLVDADLANNTLGWQWAAGCGADAAPYFRIFNPMLQGAKFDGDGAYVRQWVPELAALPDKHIHKPWELSDIELRAAGVTLGKQYPKPIVDHHAARERALAAYAEIKGKKSTP